MSISKEVVISPRAKRVTLQRYLLSKLVLEEEKFDLKDLCTLFANQIWLEQKVRTDNEFQQKFGKSLEDLSIILKEINFRQEFTDRALYRLRTRVKDTLDNILLPQRNYVLVRQRYSGLFYLRDPLQPGKDKKLLPQVARIGKGYRDKGTLKNPAVDGSPSWQEVAVHRGSLFHKGVELEKSFEANQRTESKSAKLLREFNELERREVVPTPSGGSETAPGEKSKAQEFLDWKPKF